MNSSDGMSSKVGVVSFATADNKAASQVFRRLQQEDDTERDPSNMFASHVAADVPSMLNIKFPIFEFKMKYIMFIFGGVVVQSSYNTNVYNECTLH
jgi:hypothetical protein